MYKYGRAEFFGVQKAGMSAVLALACCPESLHSSAGLVTRCCLLPPRPFSTLLALSLFAQHCMGGLKLEWEVRRLGLLYNLDLTVIKVTFYFKSQLLAAHFQFGRNELRMCVWLIPLNLWQRGRASLDKIGKNTGKNNSRKKYCEKAENETGKKSLWAKQSEVEDKEEANLPFLEL